MLRKLAAFALFGISAFMALGYSLSDADVSPGITVVAVLLTVVLPLVFGIVLLRGGSARSPRRVAMQGKLTDPDVLYLASQRAGVLTSTDLTAALAMNDTQASRVLDDMVRRDVAGSHVTADGVTVYTFYDAKRLGESEGKGMLEA